MLANYNTFQVGGGWEGGISLLEEVICLGSAQVARSGCHCRSYLNNLNLLLLVCATITRVEVEMLQGVVSHWIECGGEGAR